MQRPYVEMLLQSGWQIVGYANVNRGSFWVGGDVEEVVVLIHEFWSLEKDWF